jgi:hypothetical protein
MRPDISIVRVTACRTIVADSHVIQSIQLCDIIAHEIAFAVAEDLNVLARSVTVERVRPLTALA